MKPATGATSILAGRAQKSNKSITLNKDVLKRHTAVLGGSGSGKTTLALCIIEQLLLQGHAGGADRPQGRPVLLRQPRRVARAGRRARRAARRAREAGRLHRRRRLHAGSRLRAADLDHAAAQRHQRAARPGAAAARQPVGGGARRHAALQELGHAPEAVGHPVGGAAHPRRPLQQGGDARRPDRPARGGGPRAQRSHPAHGPVGAHPPRSGGPARQPPAPQLGAVRGRRRAAAHGFAAGQGPLRAHRRAHAAVDHLHGLPRRQREHPVLGRRSSCRRRCASASATPTTSCRPW